MLKVSNITKSFVRNNVEFNAVDDVSFEANNGELIAFTGHSGSGKTVLMTTHELEYVRYADRVLNMNKGKLISEAFTE